MQRHLKRILNESDSPGFTVLELLLVITIIGVVVAISMPNLKKWHSHSRVNRDARIILGAFQHARIEAVKRNEFVSVVFTNNNTDAKDAPDYRIFVDENANRTFDVADDTSLSLVDLNYAKHTAGFSGGVPSAIFNSRGMPSTSAVSINFIVGNVELKSADDSYMRKVIVSESGRIRIE